jgi:uncharacterized membrane protein YuzA (DUF378 family)
MLARIHRLVGSFFNKTRTINNEPLNRVSLIVIILVDIFILVNVFTGLHDISRWYVSPFEAYPCYSEWQTYQTQTTQKKDLNKDLNIVKQAIHDPKITSFWFEQSNQQPGRGRLGTVSPTCLQYARDKNAINNAANWKIIKTVDQNQINITSLEGKNYQIRAEYGSSLLEKIANQPLEQSINLVAAGKAKQTLDQNNLEISRLKKENSNLHSQLVNKPESVRFLTFLNNGGEFSKVEQGYKQASFWYPSIQLAFQSLFLVPLIVLALSVHHFSQRRGYGLVTLISWHLLVIFFIPLILKIFEFLQVGVLFQFVFDIIRVLFGGLLFLVSYVYILLIPLCGFALIKLFQKVILNPKAQAANRVQKSRCIRCAKRIQPQDAYCPHCGYYQSIECPNCHHLTYKHLPYCKQCGSAQELSK